jgi:hypothetical protein
VRAHLLSPLTFVSQSAPMYPLAHWHLNELIPSMHWKGGAQGDEAHSLI